MGGCRASNAWGACKVWCLALVSALLLLPAYARRYETSAVRDPQLLNVHIVPHSHDDAGWLKTVDQYYYGANNSIQVAGVQYILDSVVCALLDNPDRRFIYAEMAFFMRWWRQQDAKARTAVQRLVEEGRLEIVNGGYVQNDEAAAHYVGMIDQMTLGHRFLKRALVTVPRVGWQIDPFGHSATQASLLSAGAGFDALFFGRSDYQDLDKRKASKALEMVWDASGSVPDSDVFAGSFASGNYGPPEGFWWEWTSGDPPIMDDPQLGGYNVEERVETFVQRCLALANVTRGNDIMLTWGSDFHYQNAHLDFKNLDKLLHYVNLDGRVRAFYSTPSRYVEAKHAYDADWPVKRDDFFPYADSPHAYWTGYFSSRAASKRLIRHATSYLQAARQLEAFVGINKTGPRTASLAEAVALAQHHDAVTGTAKQHVADDYAQRLAAGLREAEQVVTNALSRLIQGKAVPPRLRHHRPAAGGEALSRGGGDDAQPQAAASRRLQGARDSQGEENSQDVAGANPLDAPVRLESCSWLNASACEPSVRLTGSGAGLQVAVYNPLAWSRESPVRVPVNTSATCEWVVLGPEGEVLPSALVPVSAATAELQHQLAGAGALLPGECADAELVFVSLLPPLGYNSYLVKPVRGGKAGVACASAQAARAGSGRPHAAHWQLAGSEPALPGGAADGGSVTLDNGVVALEFSTRTGLLVSASTQGVRADLSARFLWYNSSDGLESQEDRGQASGAYIFRPNGVYDVTPAGRRRKPVGLQVVQGDVVSEARQTFSNWATLVTRLYRGQPYVEFEWTVGPIPTEDGLGKEVVLRYDSDLASGTAFWTDSNGREMLRRTRDARPTWELNVTEPVAGNYYPLTAAMYLEDEEEGQGGQGQPRRQLALLTNVAQGGASLAVGSMEVMVHRRALVDDARGVGEPLNETACGCTDCDCAGLTVRGTHWLVLAPVEEAVRPRRTAQQLLNDPPVLAFGPIPTHVGAAAAGDAPGSDAQAAATAAAAGKVSSAGNSDKGLAHAEQALPVPAAAAAVGGGGIPGLRRSFSLSEGAILHSGVHLLTLMDTGEGSYLVRLAHLYQLGEDDALAAPVTENLNVILQLFSYRQVRELTVTANQLRSEVSRLRFRPGRELGPMAAPQERGSTRGLQQSRFEAGAAPLDCGAPDCDVSGELLVRLAPMELRTFELVYSSYQAPDS